MTAKTHTIDPGYENKMFHPATREYYGHTDFYNFGYWRDGTATQREACENLMEVLLGFIPAKTGKIIDVACGMGATTRHLLKYYDASDVIGINISPRQLKQSEKNAPGSGFLLMDATRLGFATGTAQSMISVEAAFHFVTREIFLREAYRVLEPGGRLVLSDILVRRLAARWNPRLPEENWVENLDAYAEIYKKVGFQDVEVVDATRECWVGHSKNSMRWRRQKLAAGELSLLSYIRSALAHLIASAGLRYYLLVSARKAGRSSPTQS